MPENSPLEPEAGLGSGLHYLVYKQGPQHYSGFHIDGTRQICRRLVPKLSPCLLNDAVAIDMKTAVNERYIYSCVVR